MFDLNLKYIISVFGDFNNIDAVNSDCTIKLIESYKQYNLILSTFQEVDAPMIIPGIPVSIRPMLTTPNSEWSISIGKQRIDIEKNPINTHASNMESLKDFLKTATEYIEILINKFNINPNRLALNTHSLLKEMKKEELERAYRSISNGMEFYQENIPFEWSIRLVSKLHVSLNNDAKETINVITNVIRSQGKMVKDDKEIDRIGVLFDINTIPQNTRPRFKIESIKGFLDSAIENREIIIKDLERLFYGVNK